MTPQASICRATRERWSAAFDDEQAPDASTRSHVAACPECAAFTRAAVALRVGLHARPLPAPDPAADHALLAALRAAGDPALLTWLRRPGPRLALAGAASFAVTLVLAARLAAVPGGELPTATARTPWMTVPRRVADLRLRLENWLAMPVPRAHPPLGDTLPSAPTPAPRRSARPALDREV